MVLWFLHAVCCMSHWLYVQQLHVHVHAGGILLLVAVYTEFCSRKCYVFTLYVLWLSVCFIYFSILEINYA